ncbi:MAG TPA: ATP-binding protein, partial [Gammaproteobacteria bacterium]|nr:ATP-binding protein [Gammaproteobacteria bacterium]
FNLVSQIMDFAREQNITKLIVGKTAGSRWVDLLRGSLADEFVRYSGEIDVYIITSQTQKTKKIPQVVSKRSASSWKSYLFATLAIALTTGINFLLLPFFNDLNLMMVYLLSLTGIALFGEIGPTMMASMLSFLSYVFLLQGPTLVFSKLQDIFSFLVLLVLTQVISRLTRLMRRQAETSNAAERRSAMLQSFSRELGSATDEDKLLQAAVHYLAEFFNSEVVVLLSQDGHLEIKAAYKTESLLDTKEQGVAQWVYDLGQIAGLGTDTLPFSDSLYLPIKTSQETLGVLALRPPQKQLLFTLEQIHLLEACANQIALALEVERLQEQSKKSEFPTGSDRMRSSLLQAVSKEMRLPLISVMSAASTLTEMSSQLKPQMVNKLATVIYTEASQIGHFINNLLQITYLESEEIKLKRQLYSLPEGLQVVLKTLDQRLGGKPVKLHFPDPCPLVPFDKVLLDEVFYSLIDNAIKYTKPHSQLDISGAIQGEEIIISIEDRGPGIIANELDQLFEKFYRGRLQTTERGLGLGLAICHHIIIAHGGKIWAENRKAGGAAFRFSLPLKI